MSGERTHAAAIKAAITAATAALPVFDYDEAQDAEAAETLPDRYALITISQRLSPRVYMSGGRAMLGWRLTCLAVGRNTAEARWVREHVALLADKPLAALNSSPLRLESENPIEPDEGRQSGITIYTYAAPA